MVNPNSWASVLWDFVTVLFVFYDMITLPLQAENMKYIENMNVII